jgi:hypothetical protein
MNGAVRMVTVGWALSGLAILFLAFDVAIKLVQLPVVGETLAGLGYSPELGLTIGIVELVCLVLYLRSARLRELIPLQSGRPS